MRIRKKLLLRMFVTFIIAFILSLVLPVVQNKEISAALAPATFLFGAIYGFQIALVLKNFTKLRELLANEIGDLVYVFHIAKGVGGTFGEKIGEKIENYFIDSIDHSLTIHISATTKDFASIVEPIESIELKNDKDIAALNGINRGLLDLAKSRAQMGQVAPREVSFAEWILLGFLASIIIAALFFGRESTMISVFFISIFSTALISTLFLLNEADSNHLQEVLLQYEEYNQALEEMGKICYYPEFAIKKKLVKPSKDMVYRLGIFPKYPDLTEKEVKIIEG